MQFNSYAIVTGASTGIGRTISLALAKKGFYIILLARNEVGLKETKRQIEEERGKAKYFLCDLSDTKSINKFIQFVKKELTHINILVNVAGIWHGKNEVYADIDFAKFKQKVILDTYHVGITAPTLLVHGLIPLMPKGSKIINISGTFESGAKGWLPYYVSKRAIEDLTVGLAQELKDKNIQVNCISPSDIATEAYKKYFPQYIKDAMPPERIAEEVANLCSGRTGNISGEITVVKKDKKPFKRFHY